MSEPHQGEPEPEGPYYYDLLLEGFTRWKAEVYDTSGVVVAVVLPVRDVDVCDRLAQACIRTLESQR